MEGNDLPAILKEFNWLDIVYVILLLGMVYKGSRTGVGSQVLSLIGWFVLLFVSVGYYSFLSEAIFGFMLQKWAKPISFAAIAAFVFVIVKFLERIFHVMAGEELSTIEKVGGALVGGARACIFCGLIGILLLLVPVQYARDSVSVASKTGMFFVDVDARIYSWIAGAFGTAEKNKDDLLNEFLMSDEEKK